MTDIPVAVGLGAVGFLSTNGDNLLLLLAFLADPAYRPRQVIVGYCVAMAALFGAAGAGAAAGSLLPVEYLGFLGVVPLVLGVRRLIGLVRPPDDPRGKPVPPAVRGSNTLTVALIELANGADTVAVFAPLLAESRPAAATALGATFVAMTAAWCAAAYYISKHPATGDWARRYSRLLVPFALIGLGLYILFDTTTDLVEDYRAET